MTINLDDKPKTHSAVIETPDEPEVSSDSALPESDSALPDFEHENPVIKNGFIDSIRPGGLRHRQINKHIEALDSKIGDLQRLLSSASDADLSDLAIVNLYGLKNGKSPTEQRVALPPSIGGSKGRRTALYNEIKENEAIVAAHDAGEQLPGFGTPNVWSPAQNKTAGPLKHAHRMYHEGIPLEEFRTNPDLQFTPRGKGPGDAIFIGGPKHVGVSYEQLVALHDKLKGLALRGVLGKHWYDDSSDWINHIENNDPKKAERLARVLAITSSNTPVDENLARGMRAHNTYKRSQILGRYLPIESGGDASMDRDLEKAYYGGIGGDLGQKVSNFYQNLMKRIDPSVPQYSTQDRHMMRAFGYEGKRPLPQEYAFMHNMLREVANHLTQETGESWSPDQVQAAAWTAHRSQFGDSGKSRSTPLEQKARRMLANSPMQSQLDYGLDPDVALNTYAPIREHNSAIRGLLSDIDASKLNDRDKDRFKDWIQNPEHMTAPGTGSKFEGKIASVLSSLASAKDRAMKQSGLGKLEKQMLMLLRHEYEQRDAESASRNITNPQMYNFVRAAHSILPSQLNFEAIPSPDAVDMNGFQQHAPYYLRQQLSREIAPIARDMLNRLGLPKQQSDVTAMGDWGNERNQMYGIGYPVAQDVGRSGVHTDSGKNLKLAADTLALAFRQNGVPYMNLHPINPNHEDDPMQKANAASFKISGDKGLSHEEIRRVTDMRDKIAGNLGIDTSLIPIIGSKTQESPSLTMLNLTGMQPGAWHLSNAQFHGLARLIIDHSGLPGGMNIEHHAAQNYGDMTYEDWKDSDSGQNGTITKRAGDTLRNEIRKTGGSGISNYADDVFARQIKPVLDRYSRWREWGAKSPKDDSGEDARSRTGGVGSYAAQPESGEEQIGLKSIRFSEAGGLRRSGAIPERQAIQHEGFGEPNQQFGRERNRAGVKSAGPISLGPISLSEALKLAGITGQDMAEVKRYAQALVKLGEGAASCHNKRLEAKMSVVLACIKATDSGSTTRLD